jgi:hypothetical protein
MDLKGDTMTTTKTKVPWRLIVGYIVAALFTVLELLIISLWPTERTLLIPTVGLLTFFGVLIIVNIFSGSHDMRKGEVRNAIAASLLAVYFFLISGAVFAKDSPFHGLAEAQARLATADGEKAAADGTPINDIVKGLLDDYTSLIMVVVGFYFAGRSAEEIVKTWRRGKGDG